MGPAVVSKASPNAEFDVAEFSLGTYVILLCRGDRRMIAIPVFPSRKFRHGDIYTERAERNSKARRFS
jgi:4,5-dihydroxyphthalate decarboxylase